MDVLSRVFNILQRVGGMEQIGQFMTIVYGIVCVFGILNCLLGYRILRFWMMIFGFLIGAGAGFGVTYLSGVEDKMVIAGAMAGLGIVLAIVSFLVYRAGIFVLGFGIGISLSIYLVHPTSSFSFFLCILVGVGLGILAMRYAKGVIIIGTSILGGVLAGVSIAKIGGLEQFPYGVGMAVGIALLGMLIQFAINKDHYDDDDEDDDEPEEEMRRSGKKKKFAQDRENVSEYNGANRRRNSSDRYSDARNDTGERKGSRSRSRNGDSDRRNSSGNRSESRRNGRNAGNSDRNSSSDNRRRTSAAGSSGRSRNGRNSPSEGSRRSQSRSDSENSYSQNRRNTRSAGRSYYDDGDDYDASRERFDPDYRETPDTYEDFEKSQQRKRQLDIENMADFEDDEFEQLRNHEDSKNNRDLLRNLEPDDYDEWEDN